MEKLSTIQQVNSSIMFGDFTNEQLESIVSAVKYRRGQLTQEKKREFRVGSSVKFYNNKRGMTLNGQVTKVAIKFITVSTSAGLWRVPANMLEAA